VGIRACSVGDARPEISGQEFLHLVEQGHAVQGAKTSSGSLGSPLKAEVLSDQSRSGLEPGGEGGKEQPDY
jgi:hypothetical protein